MSSARGKRRRNAGIGEHGEYRGRGGRDKGGSACLYPSEARRRGTRLVSTSFDLIRQPGLLLEIYTGRPRLCWDMTTYATAVWSDSWLESMLSALQTKKKLDSGLATAHSDDVWQITGVRPATDLAACQSAFESARSHVPTDSQSSSNWAKH